MFSNYSGIFLLEANFQDPMASFSIVGPNEDNPDVISCLLHLFSMNTFYSQQKGIETLYSNLWDPASGKKLKMSLLASRAFWISLIANILISKNKTVPTYIKKNISDSLGQDFISPRREFLIMKLKFSFHEYLLD